MRGDCTERVRLEALEQLVAEQGQRIAALEAQQRDAPVWAPDPLRQHNLEMRACGQHLRERIRQILETDTGRRWGAAKRVLAVLPQPDIAHLGNPLRTVQHHITQLRKAAGLAQIAVAQTERQSDTHVHERATGHSAAHCLQPR